MPLNMKYFKFLSLLLIVVAIVFFTGRALAQQPSTYKTICHHTPGNDVTISFQNQQAYEGHLGQPHNEQTFDTDGACQEDTSPTPDENKVTLCHATGSTTNPFVVLTVAESAAYNGHLGSSHQNGNDIIPPFEFQGNTYSQNWDANGQATFNNNCIPTNATPTPTIGAGGSNGGHVLALTTKKG
jgi:hypothetical protein